MKVEVLGAGCARCRQLYDNAREALALSGRGGQVVKVDDVQAIAGYGVLAMPALVVDGEVKTVGRLLTPQEIVRLLA